MAASFGPIILALSLCLGAGSSTGSRSSWGDKSCENQESVQAQTAIQPEADLRKDNLTDSEKPRWPGQRSLFSVDLIKIKKKYNTSSYMLDPDSRLKLQQQQQQFAGHGDREVKKHSNIQQPARHQLHNDHKSGPAEKAADRAELWKRINQKRLEQASLRQRQMTTPLIPPPPKFHRLDEFQQHSQKRHILDGISDIPHSFSSSDSRKRTFGINYIQANREVFNLHKRPPTSEATLVTESTVIYPFISTTRALDYLTSYDSLPLPTRWPVKMILPDRTKITMLEKKDYTATYTEHSSASSNPGANSRHVSSSFNQPFGAHEVHEEVVLKSVTPDIHEAASGLSADRFQNLKDSSHESPQLGITHFNSERSKFSLTTQNNSTNSGESKGQRKRLRQQRMLRYRELRRRRKGRQRQEMPDRDTTTAQTGAFHQRLSTGSLTRQEQNFVNQEPHELNAKSVHSKLRRISESQTYGENNKVEASSIQEKAREPKSDRHTSTERTELSGRRHPRKSKNRSKNSRNKSHSSHKPHEQKARTGLKGHSYKVAGNLTSAAQANNDSSLLAPLSPEADVSVPQFSQADNKKLSDATETKYFLENCSESNTTDFHDNTGAGIRDGNWPRHLQVRKNCGPDKGRTSSVSQVVWDTRSIQTKDTSNIKGAAADYETRTFANLPNSEITTAFTGNRYNTGVRYFRKTTVSSFMGPSSQVSSTSPQTAPVDHLASARRWRDHLKQKQPKSPTKTKDKRRINNNPKTSSKDTGRSGNLASAFPISTLAPASQSRIEDAENKDERRPFIGYKNAYDFLSNQKGARSTVHNEARREANELNRFMGEGMCEIFNKHYVPTRIGGKCE